jgi:hypothetical protein
MTPQKTQYNKFLANIREKFRQCQNTDNACTACDPECDCEEERHKEEEEYE